MKAHIITGNREQIAEKIRRLPRQIVEAIVFIPEAEDQKNFDIFAEMEPHTVQVEDVDDSREAIYSPRENELFC